MATGAFAIALTNGRIFVTYNDFSIGQQILIWTNTDGTIVREDTLGLSNITFAYSAGPDAYLVEVAPSQSGVTVTLRPFDGDGNALSPVTLYSETFEQDVVYNWTTFEYGNGQLLMLLVTQRLGTNPIEYTARIVRRTGNIIDVYAPWQPGPVSPGQFARGWMVTAGPWNTGVIGYIAGGTTDQQVWVQAFDDAGQTHGYIHTADIDSGTSCNFVDVFVDALTVYTSYTTTPLPDGPIGGAFLTGFPLDEILAVDENFIPQPASFTLSAYPNPFNPTTTISFSLPSAGFVELIVYDLTGREVSTLLSGMKNAGQHSITWNANGLTSGIYFARMLTGDVTQVRKLVLMK